MRAGAMASLVRSNRHRSLVALVLVVLCGCTHTARVGPTVPLTTGDPRGECEQTGWLELARAEVRPWGASPAQGLGIFRPGQGHPEDLERVVGRLQEPTIDARVARVEHTDAANRRSLTWSLGGLGGLAVGLGTAVALDDRNHPAANVFGIAGLAIGLAGVIGALVALPSAADQLATEGGHYMFFTDDDVRAAMRGTERSDQRVRQACAADGR